mmetsp:Transcript_2373/g.6693  ORF Transcript_2373/g.6693 Transcript_2373/m.6693 type:complete len:212 (+) Transcript_2373:43-678(+)
MLHSRVAADAPRQLDVPRHDRDALPVHRAQVRILEKADDVVLGRLLQSHERLRLEAHGQRPLLAVPRVQRGGDRRAGGLRAEVAHHPLEAHLRDEQLCRSLVVPDLHISPHAWPVPLLTGRAPLGLPGGGAARHHGLAAALLNLPPEGILGERLLDSRPLSLRHGGPRVEGPQAAARSPAARSARPPGPSPARSHPPSPTLGVGWRGGGGP